MNDRLKGALILLLIFVPILLVGGIIYKGFILLIGILALKEIVIKEYSNLTKLLALIYMIILMFNNNLGFEMKDVIGLLLTFLTLLVYYHDNKKYNINDALYLIGVVLLLSFAFKVMIYLRLESINLPIYLLAISTMTDTFALLTGVKFGKTKLVKSISPNKTVEGLIGGTLFGTLIGSFVYYLLYKEITIYIVISTLFLSIIGQLGDLVFSSIKREYKIKDYSNLIPGHGGVLDRLDSIIFITITYIYFI